MSTRWQELSTCSCRQIYITKLLCKQTLIRILSLQFFYFLFRARVHPQWQERWYELVVYVFVLVIMVVIQDLPRSCYRMAMQPKRMHINEKNFWPFFPLLILIQASKKVMFSNCATKLFSPHNSSKFDICTIVMGWLKWINNPLSPSNIYDDRVDDGIMVVTHLR